MFPQFSIGDLCAFNNQGSFFPREMYWQCSLGGFWVLGGVSKMSTVMSCRDGGRKCFMMVMVMTITMILMAMMILDISRYGEQVSFGSSGWNHPHIPHPVFVSSSSCFSSLSCWYPVFLFFQMMCPTSYLFVSVSSSFSKSFLFTAPLRNNLLNGHSLPLWFMTHEALISFEDESIVIDLHSLFSFERRALLSSLELRLLFDPTLSSFPPFLWPQLSKLGKFISVRGNYQLPQRFQKTASPPELWRKKKQKLGN